MIITNMKTIIAGGRDFIPTSKHKEWLLKKLKELGTTEIVCGMAMGADILGLRYAKEMNYCVKKFPAGWNKYGKSAGYKRNLQMGEYADALICFWDGKSRGSKLMIDIAEKLNLPTRIIYYGGNE